MDGRNMRELSKNEMEEVNGGVGSLVVRAFFVGRMAVTA
jgi:lactobin A/cerein 7B family class IIb bacteriocin